LNRARAVQNDGRDGLGMSSQDRLGCRNDRWSDRVRGHLGAAGDANRGDGGRDPAHLGAWTNAASPQPGPTCSVCQATSIWASIRPSSGPPGPAGGPCPSICSRGTGPSGTPPRHRSRISARAIASHHSSPVTPIWTTMTSTAISSRGPACRFQPSAHGG